VKTYLNLAIAFILGLLVAITIQPSQAAPKTYDAVKLAEYSACLQKVFPKTWPTVGLSPLVICLEFRPR